jgi:hypothetical protein
MTKKILLQTQARDFMKWNFPWEARGRKLLEKRVV